jgi:hypothetical protein
MSVQVLIKAATWGRESHGLFDYETKMQTRVNLRATETTLILIRGNEVFLAPVDEEITEGVKLLAVMLVRSDAVLLLNDLPGRKTPRARLERMWLVVSSLRTNGPAGYRLAEGDVLRLGRICFRVKELLSSSTESSESRKLVWGRSLSLGGVGAGRCKAPIPETPIVLTIADEVETKDGEKMAEVACKICLMEGFTEENPMITPCTCKGTMRYIHLECLQRWLNSKITTRERGNSRSYSWKALECSLCKTSFPSTVIIKGHTYDLVSIPKPEGEFITLEAVQRPRDSPQTIHLIPLQNKNNVRLGRGHDSDVRISDISVSRNHALVRYDQGKLILEDNESKFGTLVQVRRPIALDAESNFSIQCGRTVLSFACRMRTRCFSCFGCGQAEPEEALPLDQFESLEADSSGEERNFTDESLHEDEEHPPPT